MNKLILFISILIVNLFSTCEATAQDSAIVKIAYAGCKLIVPVKVSWKINNAFITSGDEKNILISIKNFKQAYQSKSEIVLPNYIAEMELLDKKSQTQYILYINQRKEK